MQWPNVGHVYPPFVGIPEEVGVTQHFPPLSGPEKVGDEAATFIFFHESGVRDSIHALLRGSSSWGSALTIHAWLRGPLSWGWGLTIHALLCGSSSWG